jgi:hypothetical protein
VKPVVVTPAEKKERASRLIDTILAANRMLSGSVDDTLITVLMAPADTLPQITTAAEGMLSQFDAGIYNFATTVHAYGNTAQIIVSVDETIGHYADWLSIPAWHIRKLNNMSGRSDIRIGRRLAIPGDTNAIATFNRKRLEYHMAVEEDFYGQFKVASVKSYTLRRGEALWDICNSEEAIPMWLMQKYNKNLDLGSLMPGAIIYIPVVEEKVAEGYAP